MSDTCPGGTPKPPHGKPRPESMYWRGRYFAGLYCKKCNALYDNPDDSMNAHIREAALRDD